MKQFDYRNTIKKKVHAIQGEIFAKQKEMWYAILGCNIGAEQDGKGIMFTRPVIILKKV